MALQDRDYMRPDYKGKPPEKRRAGPWARFRFFLWRLAKAASKAIGNQP